MIALTCSLIDLTKNILNKAERDYIVKICELLDVMGEYHAQDCISSDKRDSSEAKNITQKKYEDTLHKGCVLVLREVKDSKNIFDEKALNHYLNSIKRMEDIIDQKKRAKFLKNFHEKFEPLIEEMKEEHDYNKVLFGDIKFIFEKYEKVVRNVE